MTKRVLWLLMAMAGVLPSSIGRSEIIISVDMDAATPGIQSFMEGIPGTTITAGLWMQLTGSTSIATYNFSVEYDRSELTFQSRSETPGVLTGLSELDTSNPVDTSNGRLRRFDGGTFATGPVAPFGPVRIGEITFSTLAPTGGTGDFDITPGRFEPLFDTFFDNAFNEVTNTVTFNPGSFVATAIPEPTSMTLLGLAIASGAFLRRRQAAR
jgi:PEP-CTERM motif